MSVLVVGVSHRTAPVSVLEKLAVDAAGVDKLLESWEQRFKLIDVG